MTLIDYFQVWILAKTEPSRQWIRRKFDAIWFQIAGLIGIGIAFVWFGKGGTEWPWIMVLIPVGILEILVIWVWRSPITGFARRLLKKKFDILIGLGLVPLTWAIFGPTAAGLYFIGYLVNHLTEAQPRD